MPWRQMTAKMRLSLVRGALALLFFCSLFVPQRSDAQQGYPNKPIRLISPYSPGGGTSIMGNLIAEKLGAKLGQRIFLDNRPGGSGTLGTGILAKSAPDGYTLVLLSGTDHMLVSQLIKTPYDPITSFAPIATLAIGERLLVANAALPANTLQELIALAKAKPGSIHYGSSGTGSAGHVHMEMLNLAAGTTMVHVPYKGAPTTDLIAGQIQLYVSSAASMLPHINTQRLKGIAVSGSKRLAALPQVPTFTEAGLPNFDAKIWYAIMAPAGTPQSIVEMLSTEITALLTQADVKEKLQGMGVEHFAATPDQIVALMKSDAVNFSKVIKTANIKID